MAQVTVTPVTTKLVVVPTGIDLLFCQGDPKVLDEPGPSSSLIIAATRLTHTIFISMALRLLIIDDIMVWR